MKYLHLRTRLAPGFLAIAAASLAHAQAAPLSGAGGTSVGEGAALVRRFKAERIFWKQFEIARELARLRDPRIISALAPLLLSPDRAERCNVGFVLARGGDGRGLRAIVRELSDTSARAAGGYIRSDGSPFVEGKIRQDRHYAAHVLGVLGDRRAVAPLEKLLREEGLGDNAAWALGQIGDKRAIPALRKRREELAAGARRVGLHRGWGLGRGAAASFEGGFDQGRFLRTFSLDAALAQLGEAGGAAAVRRTLGHPHWLARRYAIEALGEFGGREAIPLLLPLRRDPNAQVRHRAGLALAAIRARQASR